MAGHRSCPAFLPFDPAILILMREKGQSFSYTQDLQDHLLVLQNGTENTSHKNTSATQRS